MANSRLASTEYFLQIKAGGKRYEAVIDFFHREAVCHSCPRTSDKGPYAPQTQAHKAVGVFPAHPPKIILGNMASELRGRQWILDRKKAIS